MNSVHVGDRVVVTGISGFVGKVLAANLAAAGYRVIGISEREKAPAQVAEFLHDYHSIDLTRGWPPVGQAEGIVHLAGLAAVGPSFRQPQEYITRNSAMVTQVFENAVKENWTGRILVVSSGAVYAATADTRALVENSPLEASSPYVISKLLVERQAEYYSRRGIDALIVRPFNHIGPGQSRGFIVPDLFEKLMRNRGDAPLAVGNLESSRDYTDVRDIACAYRSLLELVDPRHRVYNASTGTARSGHEILEAICKTLGRSVPPIEVGVDRALDPGVVAGNSSRLRSETGWQPTIDLQKSIDDYAEALVT